MQVIGIRNKPVKYYCCDCKKKLTLVQKPQDGGKYLQIRKDVKVALQDIEDF